MDIYIYTIEALLILWPPNKPHFGHEFMIRETLLEFMHGSKNG
jgi:hypothetical protein